MSSSADVMVSGALMTPFEDFWACTLRQLRACELSAVSQASRHLHSSAEDAARRALVPLFGPLPVCRPAGVSWIAGLHNATGRPRFLVVGGEDAADMPQLHVSMVTLPLPGHPEASTAWHSRRPSLPWGRYRLGACRMGPMIYITGGTGPEGDPCAEVLAFNTLSHSWDDWSSMPKPERMPTARYGHEVVGLFGRYLLSIGGKAGFCEMGEHYAATVGGSTDVLDVLSGSWAQLPCCLEHARLCFGSAVVESPETGETAVVVSGGIVTPARPRSSEGLRLASTEILTPNGLPSLFAKGGEGGQGSQPAASCEMVDGEVSETRVSEAPPHWRPGPLLGHPRSHCSIAGPINGRLFVVNGTGASPSFLQVLEVSSLFSRCYDGDAGGAGAPPAWESHICELPETRSEALTMAFGGRLILAGGNQKRLLVFGPDPDASPDAAVVEDWRWSTLPGVELDSLRFGAKAVAFGTTSR